MKYLTKINAFMLAIFMIGTKTIAMENKERCLSVSEPTSRFYLDKEKDNIIENALRDYAQLKFEKTETSYQSDNENVDLSVWKNQCGTEFVVKFYHDPKEAVNEKNFCFNCRRDRALSDASKYAVIPYFIQTSSGSMIVSQHMPSLPDNEIQKFINFNGDVKRNTNEKLKVLKSALSKILSLINYLEDKGIIHGDPHINNLYINLEKKEGHKEFKILLRDFGESHSVFELDDSKLSSVSIADLYQLVNALRDFTRLSSVCFYKSEKEKKYIKVLTNNLDTIYYTIDAIYDKIKDNDKLGIKKPFRKPLLTLLSKVIDSIGNENSISQDYIVQELNKIRNDCGVNP